jgi:hypothetical protein
MEGIINLDSVNRGNLSVTIKNDMITDGEKTMRLKLYSDDGITELGFVKSTDSSPNITVKDTSLSMSVSSVTTNNTTEGTNVKWTVKTANVTNGTILYYSIVQSGTTTMVSGSDFTDGTLTGSFTINNNAGTISKQYASDKLLEGSEYFLIQIRNSPTGTVLFTSASNQIQDSSIPDISFFNNVDGLNFSSVTWENNAKRELTSNLRYTANKLTTNYYCCSKKGNAQELRLDTSTSTVKCYDGSNPLTNASKIDTTFPFRCPANATYLVNQKKVGVPSPNDPMVTPYDVVSNISIVCPANKKIIKNTIPNGNYSSKNTPSTNSLYTC